MKIVLSNNSCRGFTFVDFIIVFVIVLLFVGFLAMPRTRGCNTPASRVNCASNLKQVGLAFRIWANEHDHEFPMAVSITQTGSWEHIERGETYRHFQVMSNELVSTKILVCSADRKRTRATNFDSFNNKNLSYFVGVDADESKPDMVLSGDRNITGAARTNGPLFVFTRNSAVGWSKALHKSAGNVGLADGSVQQVNATTLQKQFQRVTNEFRLAIP